jgi:5,10-methylenetetrahydrofolate reductase
LGFLRVVEVFPPLFPALGEDRSLDLEEKTEDFVRGVREIRGYADVFLVADVKDPRFLKVSTVEAASVLREHLGLEAAPVMVVRDMNRQMFLSSVLTAVAKGLGSMMLVWGDEYPPSAGITNVRDFAGLQDAIRTASNLGRRAGSPLRIFAPVNLDALESSLGQKLAKERLRAGAEILLAQPPTTDDAKTFDRHASLIVRNGLEGKVLLNVFPFRNADDTVECEESFGWKLPAAIHSAAARGEAALLEEERGVVQRLRDRGFPGVYVSTRGTPSIASSLLS